MDIKVFNDGLISSQESGSRPIGLQVRADAMNAAGTAQGYFTIKIVGKDYENFIKEEEGGEISQELLLKKYAEEKIRELLDLERVKVDATEISRYRKQTEELLKKIEEKDSKIQEMNENMKTQSDMIMELTLMISQLAGGLEEPTSPPAEEERPNETENNEPIDGDNNPIGGKEGE